MNKLKRIRRVEKLVSRLQRMRLVYNYGGGRGVGGMVPPKRVGEAWSDCSGLAQLVCAVADLHLKNPAGSTWSLAKEGEAGTSEFLTLFIKNNPGDEHVIIRLRKRPRPWHRGVPRYRWCECGGSDNPSPTGGPHWFRPTDARIAEFPIHRHFPEL